MNSSGPAFSSPRLQINTEDTDAHSTVELTTASPARLGDNQNAAPRLPALQIPTSPQANRTLPSPSFFTPNASVSNSSKALNESRKLLAHLLGQLHNRVLPPLVFDVFRDINSNSTDKGLADVVQTVKAAVRLKGGKRDDRIQPTASQRDDSDEEDTEEAFTTDATFSLMTQLKDVLLISRLQNWQIFHDSASSEGPGNRHEAVGKSPFRLRRNSLQVVGGRRSRSPSPARGRYVQAPELLSQCISVLASVVSEDCRFKISSPRPSRPPNALQAVVLDIAQFLIHTQRHEPKVISQIGFALIPAFSTFHVEMQPRLLAFFEEGIVRGVLEDLSLSQGSNPVEMHSTFKDKMGNMDVAEPLVSIQIEGPRDDTDAAPRVAPPWTPWSTRTPSNMTNLQSARAPHQPLPIYYLASLIPPLLVAVLESIDIVAPPAPTLHRFCQLMNLIATLKPDAYLDLLEVVAYHTTKARRSALCLLATFWPNALGHVTISKPLPVFSYLDSLQRTGGTGPMLRSRADHPYAHQFIPWRFMAAPKPALFESALQQSCRSCSIIIHGFGLLCPFCMCAVHFDCYDYPDGSFLSQYAMTSGPSTQKVAVHRFCHILSPRKDWDAQIIKKERHAFRAVNIFSLSLCFLCRKPLWGCTVQGLKCSSCHQFIHSSCLSRVSPTDLSRCRSTKIDSSFMTISSHLLRQSFLDHYRGILAVEDLKKRTFEEISVISAILWTQLQLLNNGVALGSIVIEEKRPILTKDDAEKWELHYVLETCERYLASGKLPISLAMDEYLQENRCSVAGEYFMFFDWSNLAYISSVVKSSFEESNPIFASRDLLNVSQFQGPVDDTNSIPHHAYELVTLAHMRDALGYEFHLFSDAVAGHLLGHLHHLGFFVRQDLEPALFEGQFTNEAISCIFALPLGLDLSTDVETLFAAIEGCLLDLNLSVNEQGFLLVVRRLWPNGMASEYALRRVARNLVSWIFAEDANLAAILRDYLAQGRQLPGVRTSFESLPWPSTTSNRSTPANAANNGGDYVASRRALLNQYVARWLLALHDQNIKIYANMLYDICTDLAQDPSVDDSLLLGRCESSVVKTRNVAYVDSILRFIIKLCQNAVTFSVFDDLFLMWLETILAMDLCREPIPSLHRLFNRETEGGGRFSSSIDTSIGPVDAVGSAVLDSWRVVMKVASTNKEGWRQSLQWLCVFARSGVDIPVSTYMTFSSLGSRFKASLTDCVLLVDAALSSTWLKSVGRQELQTMISALHSRLAPEISENLRIKMHLSESLSFIRQSLAICLLLYGCERDVLTTLGMITEADIKNLPSRRKMNAHVSMASDPIIIDSVLIHTLQHYIEANVEEVSCFIAKFLNTFVTDSSLLEPYEVDNFILRNGRVLCACAWDFYDIQHPELSSIRISFLLRVLVVDAQPFQAQMHELFEVQDSWERRFLAVLRLFRIILDVTSPSFDVEDRQWRSSVIDIFYRYFNALWADEREEIRLAADSWSQSLLPAHLEAISRCWNESLAKAPIADRVKLVSFLIQLHPHFPTWKVLSWDAIIETLLEDDYLQKHGSNDDGAAAAHLSMYGLSSKDDDTLKAFIDPDMATLRVSIIFLSLQMIEDGVNIDIFSLLKIKFHLAQVVGFRDVSIVPASNGHAFHVRLSDLDTIPAQSIPCVNQLPKVLDAPHSFDLAPSAMGGPYADDDTPFSLLVGAIFVEVSLAVFFHASDLLSLPVLTVKSMLESLMIVIYKHDLDIKPLKHLHGALMRAVRRAMELVSQDISYEIRQLALSVVQAYVKRWPTLRGVFIFDSIESVAKLIVSLNNNGEDILVVQARSFLETCLTGFSASGIFSSLCKRPLDHDFFAVLKYITDANAKRMVSSSESLGDALLRDALSTVADNENRVCQIMLNNISTYIEVVHHQGYSSDLMQTVGVSLTNIARRSSDWPISFDPAPMLLILATLLQHNKAHNRELLVPIETVLRTALTRFNVGSYCLSRILHVTSTLFRKTQNRVDSMAGQTQPNTIHQVLFEILANGLRKEGRVMPSTISSMIEAILSTDFPSHSSWAQESFLSSAEDGLFFLQNHIWSEVQSENDFTASVTVAKMILQATEQKPDVMLRHLSDISERSSRQGLTVRTWNILAFAALSHSSNAWTSILFAHFPAFSLAYNTSLRSFGKAGTTLPETAQADINHAYSAIKLWLMLALKQFRLQGVAPSKDSDPIVLEDNEDAATRMIWNELWPPFALLVDFFDPSARTPSDATSLAALAWSSVADLFLFVRQSRSAIAQEAASQIALLTRLQNWCEGDSATGNRLNRALRVMSEPPVDVPIDTLVSQIGKSIIAEEKLLVLEAKNREGPVGKSVADRNRRDIRLPT